MKARIYDMEILSSISPRDIITYLKSENWVNIDEFGRHAFIFEKCSEELLVPKSKLRDYAIRISELLNTLEKIENRSQIDIFKDISYSGFDVFRIRNTSDEVVSGSLPLDIGFEFSKGASELILSAAQSSSSKKAYFAGRKCAEVEEYMRQVRMGQTEQGSFVFTFLAPIPPRMQGEQISYLPVDDPFSRKVTKTLVRGVASLNNAASEYQTNESFESFLRAVENGASANMCDAISKIASNSSGDVEINVSWARTRDLLEEIDNSIKVSRNDISIIEEASHIYKIKEPEKEASILGVIVKCHKEPDSDCGNVTILDIGSGVPRRISMELEGDYYQEAVEAHKEGYNISCTGTIAKKGQTYAFTDHSDLSIHIPEPEPNPDLDADTGD